MYCTVYIYRKFQEDGIQIIVQELHTHTCLQVIHIQVYVYIRKVLHVHAGTVYVLYSIHMYIHVHADTGIQCIYMYMDIVLHEHVVTVCV